MSLHLSDVTGLTATRSGHDLRVSWLSTDPAGTTFQVYLDGALAWWGETTWALFPYPGAAVAIDVGALDATDEPATDLSSSLPAAPDDRVLLTWQGGTFESPTLAGFRIYQSTGPGAGLGTSPVADLPAYLGPPTDGWGDGGWGDGGWGESAGSYSWESDHLASGLWTFAVVPYDRAGNAGTSTSITATVAGPPAPPAANSQGLRLTYTYVFATHVATLHWIA